MNVDTELLSDADVETLMDGLAVGEGWTECPTTEDIALPKIERLLDFAYEALTDAAILNLLRRRQISVKVDDDGELVFRLREVPSK